MRKLMTVTAALAVVSCATAAFAARTIVARPTAARTLAARTVSETGPNFGGNVLLGQAAPIQPVPMAPPGTPAPAFGQPGLPGPGPVGMEPFPAQPGIELYPFVNYRDLRRVAPCAVPLVVSVKDPCSFCDDPCCPAKCVNVQICVPECDCPPRISCNRDGSRVCYDYGRFSVTIVSCRRGVTVDYNN